MKKREKELYLQKEQLPAADANPSRIGRGSWLPPPSGGEKARRSSRVDVNRRRGSRADREAAAVEPVARQRRSTRVELPTEQDLLHWISSGSVATSSAMEREGAAARSIWA
jgi:hypothetical protein